MQVTDLFEHRPDEEMLTLSGAAVVLNTEQALTLHSGETLLHSFVCSPSELGALCAGWLISEGYSADSVTVFPSGTYATADGASTIPTEPKPLCLPASVEASTEEMLDLFNQASDKYARSHGIHECVIKGDGWHIIRTDIGRHNAIDKAIGAAHLAGYDLTGAVMFTSGRINLQTVKKAVRCGIATLMSKAVITAEALELARELGLKVLFSVKASNRARN